MRRLIPSISARLADPDAERARRNLDERVTELQSLPAVGMRVIQDVELPNATDTPISHGLGRAPQFVAISVVRGASSSGRVTETRSSSYRRDTTVVLQANGYGATVTVDILVL